MEKFLLLSHAGAGFFTLLTGIVAMLSPKKLIVHKPAGKIFSYCMWYVVISAFVLSIMRSSYFLFMVGILVFYTNTMGMRSLHLYKGKIKKTGTIDWTIWGVSLFLLAGLHSYIIFYFGFQWNGPFVVINIFTLILLLNLYQDASLFSNKNIERKRYLLAHIGKMGATFIAAITAALVQNIVTNPLWIGWMLPTAIFTPVIIYYSAQVRKGAFWKKSAKVSD